MVGEFCFGSVVARKETGCQVGSGRLGCGYWVGLGLQRVRRKMEKGRSGPAGLVWCRTGFRPIADT
jgi:hypothetical protein